MVIQFSPGTDGSTQAARHPGIDSHRLGHFRDALFEQRHFRLEQLRQLTAPDRPASDQLMEVEVALRAAAEAALADIDAALTRVGNGTYGLCVGCRRPILPERLAILPAAALCMSCQQHQEQPRH
jgi:DnaK suppressor protein